ncbi:hypothetical protein [Corynebacterium bouchesdurhonense]|uniref:hypothetical protein n=1 Tax=Corynebacterium bouchesdurhonense TaxID=1720192 RepID=UPI0008332E34|nr:hypothetical protein [Corynebacterium bouchesdurhonense]
MQFRKGLISAATAAAVLTSGVSVATADQDKPTVRAETKAVATKEGSSVKDLSPKEIQDWIAVVTAVIGLIGTMFAFGQKYLKP